VRAAKKQAAAAASAVSETKAAPADTPATEQNESNNSGHLTLGVGGLIISALGVYYQREAIMASSANRAGTESTPKKEPNPEENVSPPPTKTIWQMDCKDIYGLM